MGLTPRATRSVMRPDTKLAYSLAACSAPILPALMFWSRTCACAWRTAWRLERLVLPCSSPEEKDVPLASPSPRLDIAARRPPCASVIPNTAAIAVFRAPLSLSSSSVSPAIASPVASKAPASPSVSVLSSAAVPLRFSFTRPSFSCFSMTLSRKVAIIR